MKSHTVPRKLLEQCHDTGVAQHHVELAVPGLLVPPAVAGGFPMPAL